MIHIDVNILYTWGGGGGGGVYRWGCRGGRVEVEFEFEESYLAKVILGVSWNVTYIYRTTGKAVEYLESTTENAFLTFWSAGKYLSTNHKHKCCGFNATLTFSVMDKKMQCPIESTGMYIFYTSPNISLNFQGIHQ